MSRMKINLEKWWDAEHVCRNPHKGWYVHYFDNGLERYGKRLEPGDELRDFPGLNHMYFRLAWSFLEPQEGQFDWQLLDNEIRKWTVRGYTAAFRITCKETGDDQTFATPMWVKDAGAHGCFLEGPDGRSWEPDYGDPVFLDKLDRFHQAFAERYDGKPWVEYIDIGSYGDWGEGHTASSSRRDWPADVIKRHIDIHVRHYRQTQLVISDDIVGSRKAEDGSREEILAYLVERGVTLRDDGISVKWFADHFGESTLRSPEMFDLFWRERPIDLELQHYHVTLEEKLWLEGRPLAKAVEEAHATYIGFHGYAREWLADNPALARELANRAGYWYFPKSVELPEKVTRGIGGTVTIAWENRGVAPAYRHYPFRIKLVRTGNAAPGEPEPAGVSVAIFECPETDNRRWMPHAIHGERTTFPIPEQLEPGDYDFRIGLFAPTHSGEVPLELGLAGSLRDSEGFYSVAQTIIV